MATNFPASLDTLTNPTSSDSLSSPSHSAQHANVNDAVEALQAKVGADSSAVTSSLDYKVAQLESDVAGFTSGKILQVIQTVKTDFFTSTSNSYVDVTGVSVSITPSSATSKVLVTVAGNTKISSATDNTYMNLVRDSTNIGQSTAGTLKNQTQFNHSNSTAACTPFIISFLDSPATTSATTYKLQIATSGASITSTIGGSSPYYGAITTITVMEVSA